MCIKPRGSVESFTGADGDTYTWSKVVIGEGKEGIIEVGALLVCWPWKISPSTSTPGSLDPSPIERSHSQVYYSKTPGCTALSLIWHSWNVWTNKYPRIDLDSGALRRVCPGRGYAVYHVSGCTRTSTCKHCVYSRRILEAGYGYVYHEYDLSRFILRCISPCSTCGIVNMFLDDQHFLGL